ncbi:MAG TPA: alpha/beta hydrolase [Candidatus Kaiserbacteria bacterium]|nr:alpha/beta hydrolase [Candidatus Kaiserbacteria bacterium]
MGEIAQTDFEIQFNKKEIMEFSGTSLAFVDISPAKDIDPVPIFLAPGWAGKKMMFKEVLHSFYKKNRRVLSLVHPTHVRKPTVKDGTPLVELRKAKEILAVIENSGVSRVDAVFYSEGGINGILAATRCPEKFRNIILVDPGGFIKEDRVLRLANRFITEAIQWAKEFIFMPKRREELSEIGKEIVTYVMENPMKTIKEANAIAKENVMGMLKILHKKGIGTAIIHATNDRVFPLNNIQKIFDTDAVDYFYPTEGNHFEFLVEPEKYVNLIIHALDVEQKKSLQK